jgi:hypothetical protein
VQPGTSLQGIPSSAHSGPLPQSRQHQIVVVVVVVVLLVVVVDVLLVVVVDVLVVVPQKVQVTSQLSWPAMPGGTQ